MRRLLPLGCAIVAVDVTDTSIDETSYDFPSNLGFVDSLLMYFGLKGRRYRFPGFRDTLLKALMVGAIERIEPGRGRFPEARPGFIGMTDFRAGLPTDRDPAIGRRTGFWRPYRPFAAASSSRTRPNCNELPEDPPGEIQGASRTGRHVGCSRLAFERRRPAFRQQERGRCKKKKQKIQTDLSCQNSGRASGRRAVRRGSDRGAKSGLTGPVAAYRIRSVTPRAACAPLRPTPSGRGIRARSRGPFSNRRIRRPAR